VAELSVDQLGERRRVGFVADVPGQDSAILVRPKLIASARIVVSSNVLSLAVSPVFRCVKCLVKPVHSSTSINNSVILTCGSSIAD
jgi:hypothetical protein